MLLGNWMVRVVPCRCGSLGVIDAIMTLLAKLTDPGVKVMLQPWRDPILAGAYLVEVG